MSEQPKPTILCVDDAADIRDWMEAVLTGHGWEVVNVGGGKIALQIAQKRQPDLILLDVTMPDMR